MRPGGVSEAVMAAVTELATADRAPTLAELAQKACVSRTAARYAVQNLCRAEKLYIARTRSVAYRNRPVAEYAPATPVPRLSGVVPLSDLLAAWGR